MNSIGIDVGGSKLLAVLIDEGGRIVREYRCETSQEGSELVAGIAAAFDEVAAGASVEVCGVGVAGLVDHDGGVFVWGPHVAGTDIAVRAELQGLLGVPVSVDNDANLAAFAEHRLGAGQGSDAMLMLTIGTGIGGAMIVGGTLYRGRRFAGEFGHIRLGGGVWECDCGQTGCWETVAAGPALERLASERIAADPAGSLAAAVKERPVTGRAVSAAAFAGDPDAVALVSQVGRAFGRGLAGLIAILDPDRVVIGGGVAAIGDLILAPIRSAAEEARYARKYVALPPIVGAELGEHAGAVGAGLLALDELVANG